MKRCEWARNSDLETEYHDKEWGVVLTDDRHLFEMLILEGAQAGLSWSTILKKRDSYRQAYYGFDPDRVARFSNRLKVNASIQNAKAFLEIQKEYASFSEFVWDFVDGVPVVNRWRRLQDIPAETTESQVMSKALKKRGFKFVGPTICYAFMQSVGMVNDHEVSCFRYSQLA
jgi:DNA-3-methyladenine glycosylase I